MLFLIVPHFAGNFVLPTFSVANKKRARDPRPNNRESNAIIFFFFSNLRASNRLHCRVYKTLYVQPAIELQRGEKKK